VGCCEPGNKLLYSINVVNFLSEEPTASPRLGYVEFLGSLIGINWISSAIHCCIRVSSLGVQSFKII
jgi:hypothetical protein